MIKAIAVLKNEAEQMETIAHFGMNAGIQIITGFEQGGYARTTPELMDFVKQFIRETGILIDPVYTGKAMFALKKMLESGAIASDKSAIFLHTGGMLGLFSDQFIPTW